MLKKLLATSVVGFGLLSSSVLADYVKCSGKVEGYYTATTGDIIFNLRDAGTYFTIGNVDNLQDRVKLSFLMAAGASDDDISLYIYDQNLINQHDPENGGINICNKNTDNYITSTSNALKVLPQLPTP